MKKSYRLQNLDCANCAAKMENGLNKLPEITKATVSFMTQRMTIEADDCYSEAEILKKAEKVIRKVDPDCEVVGS